jgi:hypothetical protein
MRSAWIILLALAGTAHAAGKCEAAAQLAANIAEHRAAGVEQQAVASQLRAQYLEATAEQRAANAMTERVIREAYQADGTPEQVRQAVERKCRAGELDQVKR